MGDYFRHARAIDRSLRWALRAAPTPVGPNLVRIGRRHPVRRPSARRPTGRRPGSPLFQAAIDGGCAVSDERWRACSSNAGRFRPERFLPDAEHTASVAALPQAAARAVRAAVGDARRRAARPDDARVQGDQLPRRARLLPQVHRRRAHAPDDPQPRAADRATGGPSASGSRACSASSIGRSCSCSRCSTTTSASGRDEDHAVESAPHGARRCSSGSSSTRRRASRRRVPRRPAPEDVARRRSGATPRIPEIVRQFAEPRRRRGAAEDALPHDAGRRRGRQPRDADAVEGGAALAALRRHLQLPDARPTATRSSTASRPRIAELIDQRPADLERRRGRGVPRRAAAALPAALLARRGLQARPARARPRARTGAGLARAAERRAGS